MASAAVAVNAKRAVQPKRSGLNKDVIEKRFI
jgi:hypothetical protein